MSNLVSDSEHRNSSSDRLGAILSQEFFYDWNRLDSRLFSHSPLQSSLYNFVFFIILKICTSWKKIWRRISPKIFFAIISNPLFVSSKHEKKTSKNYWDYKKVCLIYFSAWTMEQLVKLVRMQCHMWPRYTETNPDL